MVFTVLTLLAVTSAAAGPAEGKHLIVIDPAHGGTEKGVKLSDKYYEKDITLNIATLLLKKLNRLENIRVQLTRYTDMNIPVSERVRITKTSRPDVFISLHINAGFGKNSQGYEVYFSGFKSNSEDNNSNTSEEILSDMTKNKYLNDSVRLARSIQKNMDKVFPRKDRGLRDAPISILGSLSIPAVVVEIGFATNEEDRGKIMNETTQNAVVEALYKSITEYL